MKTLEPSSPLKTAHFYGRPLRHFKVGSHWLFCLEDIIAQAGVPNVADYIKDLKKRRDLISIQQKTVEVEIEKEGKNEILEFTTLADIKEIIGPTVRFLPDSISRFLNDTVSS